MRNTSETTKTLLLAALLLAPTWACTSETDSEAAPETRDQAAATDLEDVGREMAEAGETLTAYAYDQRDEFVAWANDRLDAVDDEINDLESEIEAAGEAANEEWRQSLEELEQARRELGERLTAATESTEEAWSELQAGFAKAQQALADSISDAWSEIRSSDEEQDEAA